MRVEPEQMLEQQRIAALRRIENADAGEAVERDEQERHREHGRRQHEDDRGRIERPQEQRQPVPGQPRRAQAMDGDDEVQSGQDRRKARDEHAGHRQHHMAVGIHRRERRVEGPAGVDAADEHGVERDAAAQHEQIPARRD